MTAPEKSAMRMPWMTAPTMPTARPAAGPNANPLTMAGMAEASYLSHVTPGSKRELDERQQHPDGAHERHGDQLSGVPAVRVREVHVPPVVGRACGNGGVGRAVRRHAGLGGLGGDDGVVRIGADGFGHDVHLPFARRFRAGCSLPRRKETSPYEFLLYGLVIRRIGGACGPASHANSASSIRTVTVGSGISPDQPHALAAHEPLGAACATRPPETLTGRDDDKHQGRGLAGCRPCRVPAYRQ